MATSDAPMGVFIPGVAPGLCNTGFQVPGAVPVVLFSSPALRRASATETPTQKTKRKAKAVFIPGVAPGLCNSQTRCTSGTTLS